MLSERFLQAQKAYLSARLDVKDIAAKLHELNNEILMLQGRMEHASNRLRIAQSNFLEAAAEEKQVGVEQ